MIAATASTNGTGTMSPDRDQPAQHDVAVVGGGLAGLVAAATAAQAGRSVILFEQASAPGGRARTRTEHGFAFNIGPHALYRAMPGLGILKELGVEVRAGSPSLSGAVAVNEGKASGLPFGPRALLTSPLLDWRGKLEAGMFLGTLGRLEPRSLDGLTLQEWLGRALRSPSARRLVEISIRTATYADDPSQVSAGAGLRQLKLGLSGALYVHGGWQTIVDDLRAQAASRGARIESAARVSAVEPGAIQTVRLANGRVYQASAVILAVPPDKASALVDDGKQAALAGWAAAAVPIRAATLDLGLRRLPNPNAWFALGFDRPVYLSTHSLTARLAPDGAALIHALRYLGSSPSRPVDDERELERLLDLTQPSWRDEVVTRRFLPELIVSGALPSVRWEQSEGPRGPAVPGTDGLFVAGDWVGPDGMLADRAIQSGKRAGLAAAAGPAGPLPATGRATSATLVVSGGA
jgi:phytoene dehydrogenase-like protein